MKKRFQFIAVLSALVFLIGGCATAPKPVAREAGKAYELVVLHTNDHHGAILSKSDKGGLAERATYIKQVRTANKNVLLLDAGDINTGTAISNMFKAEPDIKAYNLMQYDAVTFGNHEFDSKIDVLYQQMELAEFTWLSANIMRGKDKYLGSPYTIYDYDGFRVGVFGLTTLRTTVIASPDKSLTFLDEVETAKKMVERLRKFEKVDVVILLGHLGDVFEIAGHTSSVKVAEQVSGIDLIIDGHSHSKFDQPKIVNGTPIVSANEWGKEVGTAKITVRDGKMVKLDWKAEPISTKVYTPDADVAAMLKPYVDKAQASLKEVVAKTSEKFEFGDRLSRKKEIALGNLVSDGTTWYLRTVMKQEVDFAFTNGGNIRTELPAGDITKEQIATVLPFDNWIFVITLKGSDLIKLMEFIGSIPQGNGGWAQMSKEMRYTITYDEAGKGTVSNVLLNGKPIDPNKNYKVGTNDYLAGGGDGYVVLKNYVETFNTSVTLRDAITEYVQKLPQPLVPATDGRITVVGGIKF